MCARARVYTHIHTSLFLSLLSMKKKTPLRLFKSEINAILFPSIAVTITKRKYHEILKEVHGILF